MIITITQAQALYIGSAIALVSGLVSFLSTYIAKFPVMSDPVLYDRTLQGLNGLLNLLAVIAAEAALHQLDWHNWLTYVGLAAAGGLGAHLLYRTTTANLRAKYRAQAVVAPVQTLPAREPGLNDVKVGVS